MVRKDPLNERGPSPPGGRPPKKVDRPRPTTLFELRPESEYVRLWEILLIAVKENVYTLEEYGRLGVPGINILSLKDIRDRISQIIEKEARSK